MYKHFKVMLLPNNKQNTKLFQYANAARFAYNWALAKENESYLNGNGFISCSDLRKDFTIFRHQDGNEWLESISNNVTKQAIKDAINAFDLFFKHKTNYPKYKRKRNCEYKFYQDPIKIKFTETHVKLEGFSSSRRKNRKKINWVRLAENRIPTDCKYYNPRISFDGLNWWISLSIKIDDNKTFKKNNHKGIGIDLGIKQYVTCSDGYSYENINKHSKKVIKLEKRKSMMQRRLSKRYIIQNQRKEKLNTYNTKRLSLKIRKIYKKLSNIRIQYIYEIVNDIVNRKPKFICIENLSVSGMFKTKYIAKYIHNLNISKFLNIISYKCNINDIKLIVADMYYPSSQLCSRCGKRNNKLKLSDRVYKCECGNIIDRDINASINLQKYGELIYNS